MKWVWLALLFAGSLSAQTNNFRWDSTSTTVSGGGPRTPLLAQPGATVYFYSCSAGVCNTTATTYQSATSTSSCPTGQQVTWQPPSVQGCQSTADYRGGFGGWFQPGQYAYIINGLTGPQYFTVGIGSSSGGITGALTSGCVVLATGLQTVGCSLATDNRTTLNYSGTGGITVPAGPITFGSIGSGVYGVLAVTDNIGPFASLQLFDPTAGGTTVDATGIYTQNVETEYVQSGTALFSGDVRLGELNNGVPGQPILIDQNGGGAIALNVGAGIEAPYWLPRTIYSAAGTPLPSCVSGIKGEAATVSDATTPTYNATYTSGGTVTVPVVCNGTNWLTH